MKGIKINPLKSYNSEEEECPKTEIEVCFMGNFDGYKLMQLIDDQ